MADVMCGYTDHRDETLVAYLYDDIDPAARASFDAHVAVCERCRSELADLGGVRQRLAAWAPPTFVVAGHESSVASRASHASLAASATSRQTWWREIPAWAQVAAALLFLGVSAGIANLDVRYDKDGLTVRTGWSKSAPAEAQLKSGVSPAAVAHDVSPAGSAPWRADLTALEQQLRSEFRAVNVSTQAVASHPSAGISDTELLRRVRVMIDENAKQQMKQQTNEIALRVAGVMADMDGKRSNDLVRIGTNIALLDGRYRALHESTKALEAVVASSQTR